MLMNIAHASAQVSQYPMLIPPWVSRHNNLGRIISPTGGLPLAQLSYEKLPILQMPSI